jgi:glycosyltransferase involved in cell wall biosynthesis
VDQSEKHELATVEFLDAIRSRIRLAQISRKGAANARNHGARLAAGSILLFVDDDDLPQPGFISGHVTAHQNPEIAAVCGAVLRSGSSLRTREELTPEELKKMQQHRSAPRDVDFTFECSWGSTSNLSVKTEWFLKVGGFYSRENAGVASGGLHDALFGHNLRHAGGRILYSPVPTVVMGRAETGGCRDLADSPQRRILEMENALNFWSRIHSSRRSAIQATFRQQVMKRSIVHTAKNLWLFTHAMARWYRNSE